MVNKDLSDRDSMDKKKRKSSSSVIENDLFKQNKKEDVYETVILNEEKEASIRTPEEDMTLFYQTCSELKTIFDEIFTLKKENSEKAKAQIVEKRIEGSLIFVLLKKLNRLDKYRFRTGRDALHKEKSRVDSNRLQLQNLLYEANHLKREIERCFQFKSQDEEIDLVSESEFYDEAPVQISRPDKTKTDEHAKRLAQLEWELQQRKELSALIKDLSMTKETVSKDIQEKTERLTSLAPCLEALLKATRPLQVALEMELEKDWDEQKYARLLPRSLYLIYANLSAFNEACDQNFTIEIEGNENDIQQMEDEEQKIEIDEENEKDDEEDENQESDNDDMEVDLHGIGASTSNSRKTHKNKRSNTLTKVFTESNEMKIKRLLKVHPLSVILTINKRHPDEKLSIIFYFFPNLGFAAARAKVYIECKGDAASELISPKNILNCLYENDMGNSSPNPKTKYQLLECQYDEEQLINHFQENNFGKPYNWVQDLCGLEFINNSSNTREKLNYEISNELAQSSVMKIIKIIQSRWNSRINLYKQVHDLENKRIDLTTLSKSRSKELFNIKISCILHQWINITWEEYTSNSITQKFIEKNNVKPTDLFYKIVITSNTIKLECLLAVCSNFPANIPLWAFELHWNGKYDASNNSSVREMEMLTNSVKMRSSSTILSHQLKFTMACFDLYVSTEENLIQGDSSQDILLKPRHRGRCRSIFSQFKKLYKN